MYRFESNIDPRVLEKRYKEIYSRIDIQKRWNNAVKVCLELAQTLPKGVKPIDLLTMKYEKLVDVYLQYKCVYKNLDIVGKDALNKAARTVYNYDSAKRKIKNFLMDTDNGFEIHNCVYCDLVDVRSFGEGKRQFDTEHILDKGECPLVGLSLYNFCPACGVCNTDCKGTNPIGTNETQMKKLSPTSKKYDFKNNVKFVLTVKPEAVGRIKYDHPEWYTIEFDYKDDDYKEIVNLFNLESRYNLLHNKLEALEWRAKAEKCRGITSRLAVLLHIKSIEQVIEENFHLEAHRKAHSCKLKLMEDMIGCIL